jgi:molecular chaperone DnaJ
VQVETPVKLTEKQRQLIEELGESLKEGGHKHSPQEKGWFDRVKDFFN